MMVTSQKFSVFFLFLMHATYLFHNAQADVVSECTNHTTCSETYGDVYNTLTSQRNYFNIALALYPSREPSAVLVHVNLSAFNRTEISSPILYTWSMSCLYAAIPARILEVLSLWSIFVTYRSRELHISILPFCCNVSENERYTIIQRALSELQDLANSPTIQDPTLNTAECITKGHTPDISTLTESRQYYMVIVLLIGSFGFAYLSGPLLSFRVFIFFKEAAREDDSRKNLAKAIEVAIYLLLLVEFGLQITVLTLLAQGNSIVLWCMFGFLVGLLITGIVIVPLVTPTTFAFIPGNTCYGLWQRFCIFVWGNLTAFHFCWLAVGIMLNTSWGLLVLLVICVAIFAIVYPVYHFICTKSEAKLVKFRFALLCITFLLAALFLFGVVMTAGLFYFVRGSVNDLFKTALMYLAVAFVTWIFPKDQEKKESKEIGTLLQNQSTGLQKIISETNL